MLGKGRAPNYRLKQAHCDMPQHTFVKPIYKNHLPEHVKKDKWMNYDETQEIMCYTSKGMMVIPWQIIEEC